MKYSFIILLLSSLFINACNNVIDTEKATSSSDEQLSLDTEDVETGNSLIKTGPIVSQSVDHIIPCTGQLAIPPTDIIAIHSKIGGQVKSIQYLPGDYVNKGAFLMSIENPLLVEKQRLLLETKAQLNYALKEYERKKTLKDGQATTEKAYDESLQQKELLTATYNGLRVELQLLGINVEALEKQQNFQSNINIYAAESGYIHEVFTNQGQMVTPDNVLMMMANKQHLHLELQVLSQDIPYIQNDQKVQFRVPGHEATYSAKIVKINPMLEDGKSTLQVHCHIDGKMPQQLLPGLFVNAHILAGQQSLTGLPENGVVKEGENYYAYQVKGKEFEKVLLQDAKVKAGFVTFTPPTGVDTWVVEGAYYVE